MSEEKKSLNIDECVNETKENYESQHNMCEYMDDLIEDMDEGLTDQELFDENLRQKRKQLKMRKSMKETEKRKQMQCCASMVLLIISILSLSIFKLKVVQLIFSIGAILMIDLRVENSDYKTAKKLMIAYIVTFLLFIIYMGIGIAGLFHLI